MFCLNTDKCDCADSSFCNPHYKHIITGDLQIIKYSKLQKLLTKGSNREPSTSKFSEELTEITTSIDT